MKAAKSAQVRESIDRGGRSPDADANREANAAALDVADDNNQPMDEPGQPPQRQQQVDEDSAAPPPRRMTAFDERRAKIIAGFKDQREVDAEDNDADAAEIKRLTRDGMPPELVPLENDEDAPVEGVVADAPVEQEAAPETSPEAPAKRKLKVRGQELEVTDEELLAYAQKGAAGDDYLNEAKNKLKEVDDLLRSTKTRAVNPGQSGEHHAGQPTDQSETDASNQGEGDEHNVDPFVKMVESVQLGTPEEAATQMRQTVNDTAKAAARDALNSERIRDEAARSHRALKDFSDANKDLANDHLAHAVMERKLYDLQIEDIRALGIDDDKLPKTPLDIANWHVWYRANGYKVRNIPELLNKAKDDYLEWKGVPKAKPPSDEPAARTAAPRVEVTVDRSQRRAAIQPQPSRSATHARPTQNQVAPPRDRSEVVQQMIANRAKPRGKTLGV
jgi:hypothetical protein